MPAFNANDPDAVAFADFITPWLRDRPYLRDFSQLHFALDGLNYLLHADRTGVSLPVSKSTAHVKCSIHDCAITSSQLDACILNFAPRDTSPLWFCRAHHPPVPGLPPPGFTKPHSSDPLS